MLSTRILTASIGVPFILAIVYYGGFLFCILMSIVSFICVQEYLTILKKYNPHTIVSIVLSFVFFLFLCFFNFFSVDKIILSAVAMLFILFLIEILKGTPKFCIARISISFLGSFIIPLTLSHIIYIRNLQEGMKLVFFLFIVVWFLDTAAYIFGTIFGKHKLTVVSPKKTIEGAIAGIIFGILAAFLCRHIFMKKILTLYHSLMLGLIIAIVGQFSDLVESIIKRDGNIKDSGKIIPGHGGVFDRFDSYIFLAPFMYYILRSLVDYK